jgi:hypothetical protein
MRGSPFVGAKIAFFLLHRVRKSHRVTFNAATTIKDKTMQTFMPYASLRDSAACLDRQRLGKQRVEAFQILRVLRGDTKGWRNHPAVRMWIGCEDALTVYMNACISEWVRRGFKNTMALQPYFPVVLPPWFGREDVHAAYRSKLLEKLPEHYSRFGWLEEPGRAYVWPV